MAPRLQQNYNYDQPIYNDIPEQFEIVLLNPIISTIYNNNTDSTIDINNNNYIEEVDLFENQLLETVVISNCSRLEKIEINICNNVIIKVEDCPNLKEIKCYTLYENQGISVTIGKGLDNLEYILISNVDILYIEDIPFNKVTAIFLDEIIKVDTDFTNFPNLQRFSLEDCNIDTVSILSEDLVDFYIDNCYIDQISIGGKLDKCTRFNITDSIFDNINIRYQLNGVLWLSLYRKNGTFPFIPLPDNTDNEISLILNKNQMYYEYIKKFIKTNNVYLYNLDLEDMEFDDIVFCE